MTFYDKFQDADWVTHAVQNSVRDALIKHKALGVAIAVWQDGQVVLIPPEQIEIPPRLPDARNPT